MVFKFNGGVLQGTQNDNLSDTNVVMEGSTNLMGNLSHAYVGAGGAKINTAGFTCGIGQALEHDPAVSTADGGLTKQGLGTLTLYKSSSYTGPTLVQAGTLSCANSPTTLAQTALTIASGATVDLAYAGNQNIPSLTIGGVSQPNGVYGGAASSAANKNAAFSATGPGTVTVGPLAPPPPVLPPGGFTLPGGVPTFQVENTVVGHQYTLVYKNALTDAAWVPLSGTGTAPGNGGTITLKDPTTSLPVHRFYRIEAQ